MKKGFALFDPKSERQNKVIIYLEKDEKNSFNFLQKQKLQYKQKIIFFTENTSNKIFKNYEKMFSRKMKIEANYIVLHLKSEHLISMLGEISTKTIQISAQAA